MWGAGAGGGGQPQQNWAFNPNQYAQTQIANEQDKWAVLAHQWIQMKGTVAEPLQQQSQPQSVPIPTNNNSNSNSNTRNLDSMGFLGEAPMDLDETVGQNQNISSMSMPLPANLNLQQSYHHGLVKPQIPPNPAISFSMPSNLNLLQSQQQIHHQVMMGSPVQQQQQQFLQTTPLPLPLMATPRLLQPSYLSQAESSPDSYSAHKRRHHQKQVEVEIVEPRSYYQNTRHHSQDNYDYDYSSEPTDSEVFEGIPRRSLPLWIREGLEKAEQEKRRLEQKEREIEMKRQNQLERKGGYDHDNRSDEEDLPEPKGYEMPKPYTTPSSMVPDLPDMPSYVSSKASGVPSSSGALFNRKQTSSSSPSIQQILDGLTEEDTLEYTMTVVRRQLTLILLEVTTDEMTQVAKESIARAKLKGLGEYDSDDSGSEGRPSEDEQDQSDNEQSNDSEAELIEAIDKKRLNFELRQGEKVSRNSSASARKSRSPKPLDQVDNHVALKNTIVTNPSPTKPIVTVTSTTAQNSTFIPTPSLPVNSVSLKEASSTFSNSRKSKSPPQSPDRHHKGPSQLETNSVSTSLANKTGKKQKSKSPVREVKLDKKHRSRSPPRKEKSGRRHKSRSRSPSRKTKSDRKHRSSRSRTPSRERKVSRKHRSRSGSAKGRRRRRSGSESSRRTETSHSHRSDSDDSRRRRRRDKRSRSSSGDSSASSYTRRRRRRQQKEREKAGDRGSSSKKKSRRSRSRSNGKSGHHRHHGRRSGHSKSPFASSSSQATSP